MHAEHVPGVGDAASAARHQRRPRVVIFSSAGRAQVEVLELADDAGVGSVFCHGGRTWRVIGIRTGDRVLIAELEAN